MEKVKNALSYGRKNSVWEELTLQKIKTVVIYFFFWRQLYIVFLCNENAWNVLQGESKFSQISLGEYTPDPLEVCIFTAHHNPQKTLLHASGRHPKENKKNNRDRRVRGAGGHVPPNIFRIIKS